MSELLPSDAANLASRIYQVQNSIFVDAFLKLPYFKTTSKTNKSLHSHLKAEVGGRVILNYRDGFGVCAQGGKDYENEVFLIFRGTTTANRKADMLTDARIGITNTSDGLPVHTGFYHCFSSMLPDIKQFFSNQNGNIKLVHCVGHSLGGAIASLAADWVARTLNHPTKLYTFGAPRVGTDWFVKSTTSAIRTENIHRVYHRTDPVPMVALYPFMQAPYGNHGHYLYSAFPLTSGIAHKMENYVISVKNKEWDKLNTTPDQPYTIESAIEAWLQSKSPVDTSSPTFWRWIESALIYVIKKIAMATIIGLQAVFIGAFTLADKIAYILAKGIDLSDNISIWVEHLMRKIMQALGMRIAQNKKELTHSLIRQVLLSLTKKTNNEARTAINKL